MIALEGGQRGDRFRAGVAAEPGAEASRGQARPGPASRSSAATRSATVSSTIGRSWSGSLTSMPSGSERAQRRGVADQAQQRVDDVGPGVRGQPDGQVDGRVAERGRGVDPAARQVEGVAGAQDPVDDGGAAAGVGDRGAVVGPHLVLERVRVHGRVDDPVLLAGHLQDEHVVGVVVRREALRRRRRDVRVDLRGMPQLLDELPREVDQRRPHPVQALEHDRRARRELGQHLVARHLVGHLGAEPARRGEPGGRQDVALVGQPDERRAQGAAADELVDGGRRRTGP